MPWHMFQEYLKKLIRKTFPCFLQNVKVYPKHVWVSQYPYIAQRTGIPFARLQGNYFTFYLYDMYIYIVNIYIYIYILYISYISIMHIYLSIYLSIYLTIYLYIYIYIYICMYVCMYVFLQSMVCITMSYGYEYKDSRCNLCASYMQEYSILITSNEYIWKIRCHIVIVLMFYILFQVTLVVVIPHTLAKK